MQSKLRVISLIASSTEIVHALGCGDLMVARSHECDYPESVMKLPVCTAPKFQPDGRSYEIDQRVKAIVQEGLSVYRVDADHLGELLPDVIITQSHCEVCAVSEKDVVAALATYTGRRPRVVSLAPDDLADIWANIQTVAEALNVSALGKTVVEQLTGRVGAISQRCDNFGSRPTVTCIEWIDPLMAAGNWMPELVKLAGGINLFGEAGKHSPRMTFEQLTERNPDIIIVLPCGFDIARSMQDIDLLTENPGWSDLNAARNNRVYVADGNQFFNRPGPRIVESLEILTEILWPGEFRFGHNPTGWISLN